VLAILPAACAEVDRSGSPRADETEAASFDDAPARDSTGSAGAASDDETAPDEEASPSVEDADAADSPADPGASGETDLLNQVPADDLLDGTQNADYLSGLSLVYVRLGEDLVLGWVADTPDERERGLMFVTEEELSPPPASSGAKRRGMLFVFPRDTTVGFWMRHTITPLDVAYIRADGIIDSIRTMEPLDENTYPPDGPYRFALEVRAGTFDALGLRAGDRAELPDAYLP